MPPTKFRSSKDFSIRFLTSEPAVKEGEERDRFGAHAPVDEFHLRQARRITGASAPSLLVSPLPLGYISRSGVGLVRPPRPRRGGRVVEGTALEMRHTGNRIVGSNPTLSASPH